MLTLRIPMSGIRWTCKSTQKLAQELNQKGHTISHMTVAQELREQKYSLQGNRKTDEDSSHPDRNEQFLHINENVTTFQQRGDPVISVVGGIALDETSIQLRKTYI